MGRSHRETPHNENKWPSNPGSHKDCGPPTDWDCDDALGHQNTTPSSRRDWALFAPAMSQPMKVREEFTLPGNMRGCTYGMPREKEFQILK